MATYKVKDGDSDYTVANVGRMVIDQGSGLVMLMPEKGKLMDPSYDREEVELIYLSPHTMQRLSKMPEEGEDVTPAPPT